MEDFKARRQAALSAVFGGIITDDDDFAHAFMVELLGDARDGERAIKGLAAGHGDRVIEQDFKGDRCFGGHRLADGEQARVEIGAITQILEGVATFGERLQADPIGALTAHLDDATGAAVHPGRHDMAANAAEGDRIVRQFGRAVMRAAGTEMRDAFDRGRFDLFSFNRAPKFRC